MKLGQQVCFIAECTVDQQHTLEYVQVTAASALLVSNIGSGDRLTEVRGLD